MRSLTIWAGGMLTGMIVVAGLHAGLAGGDQGTGTVVPAVATTPPPAPMMIYACVNNLSGAVTIVSADQKCPNNASALHWSTEPPPAAPKPSGRLRLGRVPEHVAGGAIGETDIACARGEVATGFVSWPAGRMQLHAVDRGPAAGRGRP